MFQCYELGQPFGFPLGLVSLLLVFLLPAGLSLVHCIINPFLYVRILLFFGLGFSVLSAVSSAPPSVPPSANRCRSNLNSSAMCIPPKIGIKKAPDHSDAENMNCLGGPVFRGALLYQSKCITASHSGHEKST